MSSLRLDMFGLCQIYLVSRPNMSGQPGSHVIEESIGSEDDGSRSR
jgi:hypothetical protein